MLVGSQPARMKDDASAKTSGKGTRQVGGEHSRVSVDTQRAGSGRLEGTGSAPEADRSSRVSFSSFASQDSPQSRSSLSRGRPTDRSTSDAPAASRATASQGSRPSSPPKLKDKWCLTVQRKAPAFKLRSSPPAPKAPRVPAEPQRPQAPVESAPLARGSRQRLQPLEYWRNERAMDKRPAPSKERIDLDPLFAPLVARRSEKTVKYPAASTSTSTLTTDPASRRTDKAAHGKTRTVELDLVVERAPQKGPKERPKTKSRDKVTPAPPQSISAAPLPSPADSSSLPSPRLGTAPGPFLASGTAPRPPLPSKTSSGSSSSSTFIPTPTLSHFLTTLPIPLTHLTPIFASLGCSTSADLLALASPTTAGQRARTIMLDVVSREVGQQKQKRAGADAVSAESAVEQEGLSRWERIVLEEELRAGWKVWTEAQAEEAAGRS